MLDGGLETVSHFRAMASRSEVESVNMGRSFSLLARLPRMRVKAVRSEVAEMQGRREGCVSDVMIVVESEVDGRTEEVGFEDYESECRIVMPAWWLSSLTCRNCRMSTVVHVFDKLGHLILAVLIIACILLRPEKQSCLFTVFVCKINSA